MSPEYNFYIKANLLGPREAGELVATVSEFPGVEVVQMQERTPYILVPNPSFGENSRGQLIRETRTALGLRQVDLAEAAGIANSTLSQIEHGSRSSIETLSRIADKLGFVEDDPRRLRILIDASPHRLGRRRVITLHE